MPPVMQDYDTTATVIDKERRLIGGYLIVWNRYGDGSAKLDKNSAIEWYYGQPIVFCHEWRYRGKLLELKPDDIGLNIVAQLTEKDADLLDEIGKYRLGWS